MTPFRKALLGCLLAGWVVSGTAALAASGNAEQAAAEKAAPEPPQVPSNAPYMKPLSRLASILGSVHFLRQLCGDPEAGVWRDRMNDLIATQSPGEADKRLLIASFNGGYRSYASVYRRCTPAARLAVANHQTEGVALSRDLAVRFGN